MWLMSAAVWGVEPPGAVPHLVTLALPLLLLVGAVLLGSWWRQRLRRKSFARALDGRVVVITGGAHGLGKQLAAALLRCAPRTTVVLVDIDEAALASTQRELLRAEATALTRASSPATGHKPEEQAQQREEDDRVRIFKCDVSEESAVRACVDSISEAVVPRPISVLINNAGIVHGKSIDELTPAQIRRTFEVNTLGQIWMVKAVLPLLKQSEDGGLIVSVASVMGLISGANLADYCGSKAAISAFHDCLRLELWRDGFSKIRTLLVCPNAVDTGMFHGIMEGSDWTAWLSRLLLPTTRESDAAQRIVDAMAGGEQLVVSCYTGWRGLVVPWLPSVARLLPVAWFDRVVYLGGGVSGMDTFVGRQKKEE